MCCSLTFCAKFETLETWNLSIADLKFFLLIFSPNSSESNCHNSDPISLMRLSEQSKSLAISLYVSRCRVPRSTAACKSSRCWPVLAKTISSANFNISLRFIWFGRCKIFCIVAHICQHFCTISYIFVEN